jgi:hypothetical protein
VGSDGAGYVLGYENAYPTAMFPGGTGALRKYDSSGNVAWSVSVLGGGSDEDGALTADAAGNLVVGISYSWPVGAGAEFLVFSPAGEELWSASDLRSGWDLMYPRAMQVAHGDTLFVAGKTYAGGGNLATLAAYTYRQPSPCVGGLQATRIVLYPNPVKGDSVRVVLDIGEGASEVRVDVFNALSDRVFHGVWTAVGRVEGGVTLEGLSKWAPGMYFVKASAKLFDGSTLEPKPAKLVIRR